MRKGKDYEGFILIDMKVLKKENVFVDFNGKKILGLCINGKSVEESFIQANWVEGHLDLSKVV